MYNVYITNQLQTTFGQGGGGKIHSREDFCPNYVQEFGLRLGFSLRLFNEFLLGETMVAEGQEEEVYRPGAIQYTGPFWP